MKNDFLSHADAAQRNRNNILQYLKAHQPISRTDIWEAMDISRASVTQIIRQLQESGLIVETGEGESTGGRKPRHLMLRATAKKYYAFDWLTHTLCLMDLGGNVIREVDMDLPLGVSPERFAEGILEQIQRMEAAGFCTRDESAGLVLSLPGLIDIRGGTVIYSVELDWHNVNVFDLFREWFDDCVYVERLTNILALGEHADGSSEDTTHFQLFVLAPGGVGVATIVHGNCQHGANYMYGELGHIKLPVDIRCSCGQRGCLEAIVKDCLSRSGGVITDQILEYLSVGVATSVNISDARTIVLTGALVERMDREERATFSRLIRDKVTGQEFRKLQIRFREDTKALVIKGIDAFFFDSYFPVE